MGANVLKQLERRNLEIRASTGFEPVTSANTAMLYQLSYEAHIGSKVSSYQMLKLEN